MRCLHALAAAAACLSAADDFANIPKGGKKRTGADFPQIPQAPGDGPILEPGVALQLPSRVTPRSCNLAPRRRAVLVTDGTVYRKVESMLFWTKKGDAIPYAYIIEPSGRSTFRFEFTNRASPALPYGISEDPTDGRVAVTFYQSQTDSIEVWQPPDLSWKLTYHDVSLKPTIPIFDSGKMWVPFNIVDRFLEETERVLQLYIYGRDGSRDEVFPRREWAELKYVHCIALDESTRVYAAGLAVWPWDDGVYGPVLKSENAVTAASFSGNARNTSLTPGARPDGRIEVYRLTNEAASGASPFVREQRARFDETSGGASPTREMLAATGVKYALQPLSSWDFPLPDCAWPLIALTRDGYLLQACYDAPTLVVSRVWAGATPAGEPEPPIVREPRVKPGRELLRTPVEVARFERPLGIAAIRALVLDPSGAAFVMLDRDRKRVYAAAWPLDAAALRGDGEAGVAVRPVTGIEWPHDESDL